jgi:hypothetical protein
VDRNYLFTKVDWFSVDRHQRQELVNEVNGIDSNRLLNTSVEDLCAYLEEKYRVNVPTLKKDEAIADQRETTIDVSGDRMRMIHDRSRPFMITGTLVELAIPFEGDAEAFGIQPSTYTMNPPRGDVGNGTLTIRIEGTALNAEGVRRELDGTIAQIDGYLTNMRRDAEGLNGQLKALARGAVESRRQKLLANQSLVSTLGFKMKAREGESRTYAAPNVRRKIAPALPPASQTPYKPEPTLPSADYEHILDVIQNMAHVMERSPSAFASIDEESLRSHFLVQLNGHFEGQATGETFNYTGKTDILIRSDGKNIFIAECKYWSGPKNLLATIDQVLGYSSWRDTKVAVIIFNRNKGFSDVLRSIKEAAKGHPNCKKDLGSPTETSFRYLFAHRDDPNREMLLTVLAFDVPS